MRKSSQKNVRENYANLRIKCGNFDETLSKMWQFFWETKLPFFYSSLYILGNWKLRVQQIGEIVLRKMRNFMFSENFEFLRILFVKKCENFRKKSKIDYFFHEILHRFFKIHYREILRKVCEKRKNSKVLFAGKHPVII